MSETDLAARAFEDLCAEMTVLRRSVEALPQAWRDNRSPDYTEDLARVVKAMNAVGTRMGAIEANPTLKMTPQAYGQGIREEGLAVSRRLESAFQAAIGDVQNERKKLAFIIGQSKKRKEQLYFLIFVATAAFLFGVGIAPILFRSATWMYFNQHVASFIIGGGNRWDSAQVMMSDARPEWWNSFVWEDQLAKDNRQKLHDCQVAATQVGQPKSCEVTVKPDDRRGFFTRGLYIGLDYEKVYFSQKKFS